MSPCLRACLPNLGHSADRSPWDARDGFPDPTCAEGRSPRKRRQTLAPNIRRPTCGVSTKRLTCSACPQCKNTSLTNRRDGKASCPQYGSLFVHGFIIVVTPTTLHTHTTIWCERSFPNLLSSPLERPLYRSVYFSAPGLRWPFSRSKSASMNSQPSCHYRRPALLCFTHSPRDTEDLSAPIRPFLAEPPSSFP